MHLLRFSPVVLVSISCVCCGCAAPQDLEATGSQTISVRAPAAGQAVEINVRAAQVVRRTFDPRNPPSSMPPLSENEAAVTHSAYGVGAQVQVVVRDEGKSPAGQVTSELKIESVKVDTTLAITVWLPKNASRSLVAHEEGHRRISERFYEDAGRIARQAAQPYVGRTIRGTAASTREAREAAMTRAINEINAAYMARTQLPASRVNELFDEITDHGRNRRISVEEAIERSLERHRREGL